MGLDIVAYKNLKEIENPIYDERMHLVNEDNIENLLEIDKDYYIKFDNQKEYCKALKDFGIYEYEDMLIIKTNYIGFSNFKNLLRINRSDEKQFKEIYDYPSLTCGIFDYKICEKLYNDFISNKDKNINMFLYDRMIKLLKIAKDNGVLLLE